MWTQTYLSVPEDFHPEKEDLDEAGSVCTVLEQQQGISVTQGEHQIWATGASQEEAKMLAIHSGEPILVMETKLYTKTGHLIG
ncbi:UTRA domain-containing protein [Aliibacillus thermotolerans]|nr:UTRA domain-containing protein [Aliibacillus thermotolerans]